MNISTSPLEITIVLLLVAAAAVVGGDLSIRGGTLRGLALAAILGLSALVLVVLAGGN